MKLLGSQAGNSPEQTAAHWQDYGRQIWSCQRLTELLYEMQEESLGFILFYQMSLKLCFVCFLEIKYKNVLTKCILLLLITHILHKREKKKPYTQCENQTSTTKKQKILIVIHWLLKGEWCFCLSYSAPRSPVSTLCNLARGDRRRRRGRWVSPKCQTISSQFVFCIFEKCPHPLKQETNWPQVALCKEKTVRDSGGYTNTLSKAKRKSDAQTDILNEDKYRS